MANNRYQILDGLRAIANLHILLLHISYFIVGYLPTDIYYESIYTSPLMGAFVKGGNSMNTFFYLTGKMFNFRMKCIISDRVSNDCSNVQQIF